MNPADYRAADRPFIERVQSYAESPDAFRSRWRFRFQGSSWLVAAIMLAALAGVAGHFGDLHLALKGVLAVMALIAVLPLVRDFRRPQCRLCDSEPDRVRVKKQDGDEFLVTVCHQCRVLKAEEADSSPLPL